MTDCANFAPLKGESVSSYAERMVGGNYDAFHIERCKQLLLDNFHGFRNRAPLKRGTAWNQSQWRKLYIEKEDDMLIGDGTLIAFTYLDDAVKFKLTYDVNHDYSNANKE